VDRFGILGISGSWLGVETGFVAKFVSNLTRSLSYFKKAFVQQRRSKFKKELVLWTPYPKVF
jgi:hypothetical protein